MEDRRHHYQGWLYALLAPLGVGAMLVWAGEVGFSAIVAAVFDAYSLVLLALVEPASAVLRVRAWPLMAAAVVWFAVLAVVMVASTTPLVWSWLALALVPLYGWLARRGAAGAAHRGDDWRRGVLWRAGLFAIWCHVSVWLALANSYNTLP